MTMRFFIWVTSAIVLLALAGFGAWVLSLPSAPAVAPAPPVSPAEKNAMLASLKPPKRERPLVAIIGINDATETTDYLLPVGILRRADVADVVMLATAPGPVRLFPALEVEPDATVAQFDAAHPEGADYVIVPAMSRDDDPAALAWIRRQANKDATIIGVCAGAKVVGGAGLLDGKRATTHWYYLGELLDRNPTIEYVPDRRMVSDEGVVTTTGITASMPMMLTLVEAIAGRAKAQVVAHDLGIERWNARHTSGSFKLTRPFATTVLLNRLAFWNREDFGLRLRPGMDEASLALVADAWSRTYRSRVTTLAASPDAIETANGVRIIPGGATTKWTGGWLVPDFSGLKPANALDQTLDAITARYGDRTAYVVSMQMEYPRQKASR